IWRKDPEIILIVDDWSYDDVIANRFYFRAEPNHVTSLAAHQKILELAKAHDREVWFDCHVWTDDVDLGLSHEQRYDAKIARQVAALHSLHTQLSGSSPEANFKLVVFELNANSHDQHRAVGNALAIGMMQRLGDEIHVVASANALQPDQQNDN